MFGRSEKSAPAESNVPTPVAADKKGHPTPTRKEAQAAAKERALVGMDKKAAQKVLRERRTDSNHKMRAGMKAGEEKFLPTRDQGPVRRYVRNWVDSRLTFTEFLLPILILIMLLSLGGKNSTAARISSSLWALSLLLLVVDVLWTRVRLRKALRAKFGADEDLRGTLFYAFVRVLQIRPLRLPKPQVKIGNKDY